MKSLKNNKKHLLLFLAGFSISGCAIQPIKEAEKRDNALGQPMVNLAKLTQDAWEKQDHTASADFHFALAQSYSTEGKVENAIEEYRAALIYDPQSSLIRTKLASEYLKKGSTSFAIDECQKAIEIDSKSIDAHLILGGIYSVAGDVEKAIREYEQVLKIDPRNDEAAVFKTQIMVEREQFQGALDFIRVFVKNVKDSPAAWFYAGKLEQMKGNLSASVADLRKSLELRPGFSQAALSLGMIFEGSSQDQKAQEVYEEFLDQKQDIHIAGRLATLYLKKNEYAEALKVLTIMAILDPEDLNTQMKVGLVQLQLKDFKGAEQVFLSILDKVPDSDKAHYYVSVAYEELNQHEKGIEHLLQISPDSKLFEESNVHVAFYYKKKGEPEKALKIVREATAKAPESASFYIMMASLHEETKDYAKASGALKDGLKYFPDHEKMRYFYATVLDHQAKQDEAIEEMEKILKINPNHADAMNYIAYTWTVQGVRLSDAEELLKRAIQIKPNNPFILDSMGWNQFRLGKKESALKYLEKAASLKSDEQAILEHLVEVYSRNQMPERAQAAREKLERLNTGSEEMGRMPASVEP